MVGWLIAECPSTFSYISEVNGCYLAEVRHALNWSDAADSCKSRHSNAHLVAINNAAEQTAVVTWWKTNTGDYVIMCVYV